MKLKLITGLIILFVALMLQFWFASAGWYFDFSYAALISFAFIFGFWELLLLVLAAVFIINWQPAPSVEILVFALFPFAVYFSRNVLHHWQVWLENLFAIMAGFLVLYLAVPHVAFHWAAFAADVCGGLAFGALIFVPLYRWGAE